MLVCVQHVAGSAPREVGAWMAVAADALLGSVGGGQLEYEAIETARAHLSALPVSTPAPATPSPAIPFTQRIPLGPRLGQCCGGVVTLQFESLPLQPDAAQQQALRERLSPAPAQCMPVALFGGGHVGRALVALLAGLPSQVLWVDSRDEVFPESLPASVRAEQSEPVHRAVATLAPGSLVLIMSFSHAEDLDIVAECLRRQRAKADLHFIGLIGSRSKWAVFRQRLLARGFSEAELSQVTCPIGAPGIPGKQPEVIAVAVVAQLLQVWQGGVSRRVGGCMMDTIMGQPS
ncbi:xanthine dehydrogenase accessory protein XdhC [Roseateles koreensis]|uniref:Xanthine dehydrogenase accessory protein XdhC n=1 Tax=Roseateles koreensis TaxID=2987526 RepID=A0ABT5KPA0_9BURK|nr:xanthine dehydrogenase accessory protein XdhC [Roseateles koreensis]MDC8784736.1 xanthine dehydrogenase accessory protein XdhC [Roseateles koreensis]